MSGIRQGGSTMSALPRPAAGRAAAAAAVAGGRSGLGPNRNGLAQDLRSQSGTPDKQMHGKMFNLMFDPRVIRGPTQQHRKPDQSGHEGATKKVHKLKMKPVKSPLVALSEPCTTRKHLDIQTDAYLEEFVEKVCEFDANTQTDPFLDRPPTPLFIPQKSGPDIGTQIEEGDLFNFDEEVESMLEILVGRTLEQSVMEVMEEKQLANLHAYQEHFEQIRAAELVATQRMEAAERRILDEKKKRIQQEKKRLEEEQKIKEKTEAQMYVRSYLRNLTDSIFRTLQKLNYFYDPVEKEVEEMYMPFLITEMNKEISKINTAHSTLRHLVEHTFSSTDDITRSKIQGVVGSLVSQIESKSKKSV